MRTHQRLGASAQPIAPLTTAGPIFLSGGQPWRYKCVSAFRLCRRFADGEDISGFLSDVAGYNVLRVWDYVPVKDWGASAWDSCTAQDWIAFLLHVGLQGWNVELTLLTDDDPARIEPAKKLANALRGTLGLLAEGSNEPQTHKNIDTAALKSTLEALGVPYCSGDYEDSDRWYGSYYVCHTARTHDWTRRAHDLLEFYTGAGPDKPHPPRHVPCLGDEPGKLQDVGTVATEWRAYFGACALLGAGACFHSESGKHATRLTADEKRLAAVALEALNAFPADAPKGPYRRIVEPGNEPGGPTEFARTYVVGSYAVRCQQVGTTFPEPGWVPLDGDGILWRRA
jgi:hypothetical protein